MPRKRGAQWHECDSKANLKCLEKLNVIGFPLPCGKPLLFKRLSFKFWIENHCCPNRWIFFFSNGWLNFKLFFLWKDNPSSLNGIPIDLERMTVIGFDCLFKNERQRDCLNMTWPVNMTGEWSFWPNNSPFWSKPSRYFEPWRRMQSTCTYLKQSRWEFLLCYWTLYLNQSTLGERLWIYRIINMPNYAQ